MDRNYDVITFFQKTFLLRKPGVAIFADIIKIVTMFLKTIFKISGEVEELEVMYLHGIYIGICSYRKTF